MTQNRDQLSDRRTLRRYLAIVQDPRGYPAEGLEPAPPDGPGQPTLYTVVKADEHEGEVARLRAALEQAEKALTRAARHVGLLVQYDAVLPVVVCKARDGAREALNGGTDDR